MEKRSKNAAGSETLILFPMLRRLVYDAFDEMDMHFTRTQQMIISVMSDGKILSMSELARLIDTSNEQATRAISQLVTRGFIERVQNETNHRVVNVRLTEKGKASAGLVAESIEKRLFGKETPGDKESDACINKCIKELCKLLGEKNI